LTSAERRYPDIRRDEWVTKIVPALKQVSLPFLIKSCNKKIKRRAIIDICSYRSANFGLPTKPGRVGSCISLFEACSAFYSRYGLHAHHVA
jgi:hypothetical protein